MTAPDSVWRSARKHRPTCAECQYFPPGHTEAFCPRYADVVYSTRRVCLFGRKRKDGAPAA